MTRLPPFLLVVPLLRSIVVPATSVILPWASIERLCPWKVMLPPPRSERSRFPVGAQMVPAKPELRMNGSEIVEVGLMTNVGVLMFHTLVPSPVRVAFGGGVGEPTITC